MTEVKVNWKAIRKKSYPWNPWPRGSWTDNSRAKRKGLLLWIILIMVLCLIMGFCLGYAFGTIEYLGKMIDLATKFYAGGG